MDILVGSVKSFLGALFVNPAKRRRSRPVLMVVESWSRQEDWIQYDSDASLPIDIASSVMRPKRRDVRNRNLDEEEIERVQMEEEEEEFSSTEQEDEPPLGKRRSRT